MKPLIEIGMTHWYHLKGQRSLPFRNDLDPINIAKLLGHSCLIRVINDGEDFEYKIIGSGIQAISRSGQTGKKISEIESQKKPSDIYDLFSTVVRAKIPQFKTIKYIGTDVRVQSVEVAVFPFTSKDAGGNVTDLWSIVEANSYRPED
ncbi:PAS domain-containing protein [Kiloniella laminariae]|uniref:PAS domain-containing protein n=1 Tax=Kiloniella laminariae TaxID=454162 RepID=A0ABT4LII6_9PROT|nr:PAS domain-containing protein [Kiloniella laminariae]MCZ4280171.1 PAS domain-containing protein [Kiloniella laminariae]